MAFTDYLTTTASVWIQNEDITDGGGMEVDDYGPSLIDDFACSQPVPLDPSRGPTLDRDGLIMSHAVHYEGPKRGLRPGHQLRIDGRRFDVRAELDSTGFGRYVKALVEEVVS